MRIKPLVIDLGPDQPTQPMTCSRVQGTLAEVHQEIARISAAFEQHGFPVVRIKAEAAPWNAEVPTTDLEAALHPDHYFEFHAKVAVQDPAGLQALQQVCQQHGAHLSSNAFKHLQDHQERFITLRMGRVGLSSAQQKSDALCATLQGQGFQLLKSVMEHCFLDSHLDLDGRWGK